MNERLTRRRALQTLAAGSLTGLAGCSLGSDGDTPSNTPTETGDGTPDGGDGSGTDSGVGLETLASGFQAPLDLAFVPDADLRYVADQQGQIFVHGSDGVRDQPLLDLRDAIATGYEMGLLGIALHPEFSDNRRLFVRYSSPSRQGTPSDFNHTFVLSEFRVSDDGLSASRDSEQTILEIPEPQANHNAGSVGFGPDGFCYVGTGDGGGGGDRGTGHVSDWYEANPGGNGQDVEENLLGSILRIDVDGSQQIRGEQRNYAIPAGNPLVGRPGLDEQFAWGFRNPWRMSFDGEDLFVGDVGQSAWEEVDLVEEGKNYGWNVREGAHCYGADSCPTSTPDDVRGGEELVDPIIEYPQDGDPIGGASVIGGVVYRGDALPALDGTYVFGDLNAGGKLFAATRPDRGGDGDGDGDGDGQWPKRVLPVAGGGAAKLQRLFSIERGPDGEVFVLGIGADGGGVHRLVPA